MDRLCVRLQLGDVTGCRGPHLVPDIVVGLRRAGNTVHIKRSTPHEICLNVDQEDVVVRANDATWFSVTCKGKVVCVAPYRTQDIITHVRDTDNNLHPIADVAYKMWAEGSTPTPWTRFRNGFAPSTVSPLRPG